MLPIYVAVVFTSLEIIGKLNSAYRRPIAKTSSNFSKVEGAVLRLLSRAYVDKHMDRAAMYAHGVFSSS
jgi:hypothetical protein